MHAHCRISNDKPSAIFRVKSTYSENASSAAPTKFSEYSTLSGDQNVTAILGLSVEPIHQIESQLQNIPGASGSGTPNLVQNSAALAERVVKHLINYISGFAGGAAVNSNTMIPMNLIERWYEVFIGKLKAGGPGFFERGE